jgi:hypothetical protein
MIWSAFHLDQASVPLLSLRMTKKRSPGSTSFTSKEDSICVLPEQLS